MKSWKHNWDAISPIFKFSAEVRKVIYTTYVDKKLCRHFVESQQLQQPPEKMSV